MNNMKIIGIVAKSQNNVIGVDGKLPFYLPSDLKHFKDATKGHAVLMGRKTFESIGKPLSDRLNLVVSRQMDYKVQSVTNGSIALVFDSIDRAVNYAKIQGQEKLFVIGGSEIYNQTFHLWDEAYLTHVHTKINVPAEKTVTYFNQMFYGKEWDVLDHQDYATSEDEYPFEIYHFKRISK